MHINIEIFAQLVEFNLATYEKEAGNKRPRQGELSRIEKVLKSTFQDRMTSEALKAGFDPESNLPWVDHNCREFSRLAEIVEIAHDRGHTLYEAFYVFILTNRWGLTTPVG